MGTASETRTIAGSAIDLQALGRRRKSERSCHAKRLAQAHKVTDRTQFIVARTGPSGDGAFVGVVHLFRHSS